MQTIGQCPKNHRPVGRFSSTKYIANKADSELLNVGTSLEHHRSHCFGSLQT